MKSFRLEIAIFAIGLGAFFGFAPLFDYLGDGIAINALAAGFSAIFVVLATKILLGHETDIGQKQKRSEKIFERRSEIYQQTLDHLVSVLDTERICLSDLREFRKYVIKLEAIAPDEILKAYYKVVEGYLEIVPKLDPSDDEEILGHLQPNDLGAIAQKIKLYSRSIRGNLGLGALIYNDDQFKALSEDLLKSTQESIKNASERGAELPNGIEQWLNEGGNNNQFSLTALNSLNGITELSKTLVPPLITKVTKSSITIQAPLVNGKTRSILSIWRVSKDAISMKVPDHLTRLQGNSVAARLKDCGFKVFERKASGLNFNFPIEATSKDRDALLGLLKFLYEVGTS